MKDNKWSYKPLSALCGINLGSTPSRSKSEYWGKGYSWVSISDLKEKYISKTKEEITNVALSESNCKIVKKGTLLMSFKLSIGKLAFANKDLYTNEAIVALPIKDESELNKEYLYYVLKSIPLVGGNQAAMGQTLNKQSLSVLQIPLPPTLNDQKRIAKVLSQCESLIQKRNESIDLLDELLRSTFLQMFGDPILNPKGFPINKLSDFYINPKEGTKCGPFGSALKNSEYTSSGIPVWNMDNISKNGNFLDSIRLWINEDKYEQLLGFSAQNGDIIISRAGTVGKMCVLKSDYPKSIISTNLIRLRLNQENLLPLYFVSLMNYCKGRIGRLKKGADGGFTHMNTGVLDTLSFPYPPPILQNKFAQLVEKMEETKKPFQESLKEFENLYGSISQRAFNGELDLSKVDISDMEDSKKKDFEEVKEDLTEVQFEDLIDSFEHILPKGEVPSNRETDIRNMSIRQYLGLPEQDEATEGVEFSYMNKDFFYQFILTKGFPKGTFTLPELEQYSRKYILRGTGFEFTYENWKTIIFRFIGAKQPIIEQVFDEDDKTIKLKLTDEAFKV